MVEKKWLKFFFVIAKFCRGSGDFLLKNYIIQSEGTTWCKVHTETSLALNSWEQGMADLWPEGPMLPCQLVQQGLLTGSAQAAAAKSSWENNFFSCPFSIPHSTVKKERMQALRRSLSPCYVCCHEDFKLPRESVEVVQFCGTMAGSRDSHVAYRFLCWDTTAHLCHAVPRLSHIFKTADFLCLLGK